MRRFAVLAAVAAAAALAAPAARAGEAAPSPTPLLSWPGKVGAPAKTAPASPGQAAPVALPKQFFGADGDDMAAAPPPLPPRPVPGSPAVTNTSTINTASNRARAAEIMTADSASDGPVAGVENPD